MHVYLFKVVTWHRINMAYVSLFWAVTSNEATYVSVILLFHYSCMTLYLDSMLIVESICHKIGSSKEVKEPNWDASQSLVEHEVLNHTLSPLNLQSQSITWRYMYPEILRTYKKVIEIQVKTIL